MRLLPLFVLLAACSEQPDRDLDAKPPGLDRNDPQAVARGILTAYKAKDLAALRELAGESTRPVLDELIAEGEANPRYDSIFSGYRWETVSAWTGSLSEARYSPTGAYVLFGEHDGKSIVVKLAREEGAWVFDDVGRVSPEHFQSLATEPLK